MPYKESPLSSSQELQDLTDQDLPIEVDTPQKLARYLELNENFSGNFFIDKAKEEKKIEKLDENKEGLIYRGMSPVTIFRLINGKAVEISPFKYEGESEDEKSEIQNASYAYSNAIMHGSDDRDIPDAYNFLSAAGFSPEYFDVQETGRKKAIQLVTAGEPELISSKKEADVSIEGTLNPEDVKVYCFRFLVRQRDGSSKSKTLVYRRQNK